MKPLNGTRKKFSIALTGGPGGGKTTAADLLRREIGEKIVIVPEAATIIFSGGFPRSDELVPKKAAQKAIYYIQKNLEVAQRGLYPDRILLCDRGTVDGCAFWPDGEGSFLDAVDSTIDDELNRYDAVLFFESAAVGQMSIEGGNPCRVESLEEAVKLNAKLYEIWSKHHNFFHIPHEKSFLNKLNSSIEIMSQLIGTFD